MALKAFYIDVKISGTALVYAETAEQANEMIGNSGVMVCGNSMRNVEIGWVGAETNRPRTRQVECMKCRHIWNEPVKLSASTPNISGESKLFCPACGSSNVWASPWQVTPTP